MLLRVFIYIYILINGSMKNSLSYTLAHVQETIFPGVKLLSQNIIHGTRLGSLLYSSFPLAIYLTHGSVKSWRDGIEWEGGSRGKGCIYTHIYIVMTTCIVGQQKPTKHCKAITPKFKIFLKIKKVGF